MTPIQQPPNGWTTKDVVELMTARIDRMDVRLDRVSDRLHAMERTFWKIAGALAVAVSLLNLAVRYLVNHIG